MNPERRAELEAARQQRALVLTEREGTWGLLTTLDARAEEIEEAKRLISEGSG